MVYYLQGPGYIFHPWSRLPDLWDSIINSWILAWDAHSLFNPGLSVWDAPIFYPVENALAFSETLFGNLWLTLPLQLLTGNPVFVSNMMLMAAFVLSAFCVYLLAYDLTSHYGASLVAGLIFSFSPYRWFHASHLQLLPIFWTPLAFLFAVRFLRSSRRSSFFLMLLMIWLQFYTSVYLGTMLITSLGIFAVLFLWFGREGEGRSWFSLDLELLRLMLAGLGTSVLVLLPLGLPYIQTARKWNFFRSLQESSIYSAEPLGFIFGAADSWASYGFLRNLPLDIRVGEGAVFMGLVPISLVILNRLMNAREKDLYTGNQKILQSSFFWTGLALMIIMLGPYLVLFNQNTNIPMPYQLVHYLVPGAKAMRVPARFFQPMLLCFSVLAAFSVAGFMKRCSPWPGWKKGLALLVFFSLLYYDYSVQDYKGSAVETAAQMPLVYDYLMGGKGDSPVLEIPVMRSPYKYLYYQTKHWRPAIGGISGWVTPEIEKLAGLLDASPTRRALAEIEASLAETLVINLDLYVGAERVGWENVDLSKAGFYFAGRFEDALVWERHRAGIEGSVLEKVGSPDSRGKIAIECQGKAVGMVKGSGGRLSADSPVSGHPAAFRQVFFEGGMVLLAPNGKYVSVEPGTGYAAAVETSIGDAEIFIVEPLGGEGLLLKTGGEKYLAVQDGLLKAASGKSSSGAVFRFSYVEGAP